MQGKTLGDKYQVIEKIRRQRFYDVYVARLADTDQRVIVKVLKSELVDPETTFNRLKPNLAVVASLKHEGVVSLRDFGRAEDTIYCVEEYFDGAVLSDVLAQAGGAINAMNALGQGIKITESMAFAHKKGVAHGLLTPESVIVASDLRLKTGDFYILADLTGNLTNDKEFQGRDVRYCAPEVIAGEKPSTESDVFSIGVILYELLTGITPFSKEESIEKALEKSPWEIKSPRGVNPQIPRLLDSVIIKCLKRDPGARYKNAEKLLSELQLCRTSLARAMAEKRMAENGGRDDGPENGGEQSLNRIIEEKRRKNLISSQKTQTRAFVDEGSRQTRDEDDYMPEQNPEDTATVKKASRKLPPGFIAFLVSFGVLVALIVFGIKMVVGYLGIEGTAGGSVIVPSVVGKSIVEAKALLGNKDLDPEVAGSQFSREIPEGYIISQTPPAGSNVKAGRMVELIVSEGEQKVAVPKVTGLTSDDARLIIEKAGFEVGEVREEYNERHAEDFVITQTPEPGEERYTGYKINLVVSLGKSPRMITMPRVTSLPISEARQILKMNDIVSVTVKKMVTGAGLNDYIVAQSILEGTKIEPGQSVILYAAERPETTTLTEVRGDVNMKISDEEKVQEVIVYVFDQEGGREVYRKIHEPGDRVSVNVSGFGATHVKVYIDGFLAKEATL